MGYMKINPILLTFLLGCQMPPAKMPNKSCTNLILDEGFSSIEVSLIKDGTKYWEEKAGATFTISHPSSNCQNLSILRSFQMDPLVIRIETAPGVQKGILGHYVAVEGYSYLVVVVDKIKTPEKFRRVISHEIGHSLGFKHSDAQEHPIMNHEL